MEFKIKMWTEYYKCNQIKSKHVRSTTDDCESCQNEISALAMSVNGTIFALDQGGDLHSCTDHANHHYDSDPVQNYPHLHAMWVLKSFNISCTFIPEKKW